jgi:hypothetical protein
MRQRLAEFPVYLKEGVKNYARRFPVQPIRVIKEICDGCLGMKGLKSIGGYRRVAPHSVESRPPIEYALLPRRYLLAGPPNRSFFEAARHSIVGQLPGLARHPSIHYGHSKVPFRIRDREVSSTTDQEKAIFLYPAMHRWHIYRHCKGDSGGADDDVRGCETENGQKAPLACLRSDL